MAYFQDLTPYEYFQGEKGVLNVGWLSVDYPFLRGEVQPKFVDALAILAHNPDNLCRGSHTCDICCPSTQSYDLAGRKIGLGNGEVRVIGQDRVIYSAPTLIVHYVAVHNYLPPTDFIEAVMKRASSVFVVYGGLLVKIRRLNRQKRYRLCLSLFEAALRKQKKKSLTLDLLPRLIKLERTLDTPIDSHARKNALAIIDMVAPNHAKEDILYSLHYCAKWLIWFGSPSGESDKDDLAVDRVAMALEYGFQLGLSIDVLQDYVESMQ
jgi:hypothetical protein